MNEEEQKHLMQSYYNLNEKYNKQKDEINQLKKRNKEIYDGFMATTQELTEYAEENERLNNIINEAREFIKEINNPNIVISRKEICKKLLEILDKGE